MISNEDYQLITKDIAGSRTKNRYLYEVNYGIVKIYDMYIKKIDFFVIFDYACDIEVGYDSKIDFYQLKTTVDKQSLSKLIENGKKKRSILQTLIDLKNNNSVDKLYIVSNRRLEDLESTTKDFKNMEVINFADLEEIDKKKIRNKIQWPLGKESFESVNYHVSDLCLDKSNDTLMGHTVDFLDTLYSSQPGKPKYFQMLIKSEVEKKACYDKQTYNLDETISKKGLNNKDIEKILNAYYNNVIQSTNIGLDKIKNKASSFSLKTGIIVALSGDYGRLFASGSLSNIDEQIIADIKDLYKSPSYYSLTEKESVEKIVSEYYFPKGYADSIKYLLAIYAIC